MDDSTGIILADISLAAILSTCPDLQFRNLDRALELARYAVATAVGNDAQSWRIFGICRYQIGQWEVAIAAIEKGIELRGSAHQPDWVFLAMAHLQLGNQQEAYAWFEKAKAVQWFEKTSGIGVMTMRQFRREAEELFRLVDEADAGEEEE